MINVVINIHVQAFLWTWCLISLDYESESWIWIIASERNSSLTAKLLTAGVSGGKQPFPLLLTSESSHSTISTPGGWWISGLQFFLISLFPTLPLHPYHYLCVSRIKVSFFYVQKSGTRCVSPLYYVTEHNKKLQKPSRRTLAKAQCCPGWLSLACVMVPLTGLPGLSIPV